MIWEGASCLLRLSCHATSSRTARGHRGRRRKWQRSAKGPRYICTEMHVDVHLELKQRKKTCVVVIVPCRAASRWQVVWFIAGYMLPEKVSNVTLMRFHSSTVKRKLLLPLILYCCLFWGKKNYLLRVCSIWLQSASCKQNMQNNMCICIVMTI